MDFREWESGSDNLIAYLLKGDHSDVVLLVLKDVFELYGCDEIFLLEILTDTELESISNAGLMEWCAME